MTTKEPGFFTRVALAFGTFFRALFDAAFAARLLRLEAGAATPEPAPAAVPPAAKLRSAPTDAALQLLGLLQREGRLIDFLQEDVSAYADAQIGAAARVVHDQCRRALDAHVKLERIRTEPEGARVKVAPGFSASEIRLVGSVTGEPPWQGALLHAGWRVVNVELPLLGEGHDVRVIAPAEIEL